MQYGDPPSREERLCASTAENAGLIPGQGIKTPHATESESVSHSVVSDSATPSTVACQAPLSMGFPRQEYWSGYPFPSPRGIPNPEFEPGSSALQADSLPSEPPMKATCHKSWLKKIEKKPTKYLQYGDTGGVEEKIIN